MNLSDNPVPPGVLPPDMHVHTHLCKHAAGNIASYAKAAANARIAQIGFADHAPAPDGYDPLHRMALDQFPLYEQAVRALNLRHPEAVLFGIEADYYRGCDSFLRTWLAEHDFDFVLGAVHYIDDWGFDNPANLASWNSTDVVAVWRKYFELVRLLARTRMYDILAHADLPKKFGHRIDDDRTLRVLAEPALDEVAAAGMALEINTSGLRKPVAEIYPSALLLGLAREHGIPICFGSDAHAPDEVAFAFGAALRLAREVGYTSYVRFRRRNRTAVPLPEI